MLSMQPENIRLERFARYSAYLKERFNSGMLAELQRLPQWVVWKAEFDREGKPKKAPYNPNARQAYASVKIPKSWGTLDTALTALATGKYSGIGFIVTPPFVFIDLDHAVAKETGQIIDPTARSIVEQINSYSEISPSRTGLHILAYGEMPRKGIHSAIEIYGQDRFTTITTDHIEGTPTTIEHRQIEVTALYQRYAPVLATPPVQNTRGGMEGSPQLHELPKEAEGDQVLQRLLSGDTTGYGSQSSADFVLILKLLHWTGDNIALTRHIFLSSPLGQREKATRPTGETTYVDMTINNVLRKRRNPPQKR